MHDCSPQVLESDPPALGSWNIVVMLNYSLEILLKCRADVSSEVTGFKTGLTSPWNAFARFLKYDNVLKTTVYHQNHRVSHQRSPELYSQKPICLRETATYFVISRNSVLSVALAFSAFLCRFTSWIKRKWRSVFTGHAFLSKVSRIVY